MPRDSPPKRRARSPEERRHKNRHRSASRSPPRTRGGGISDRGTRRRSRSRERYSHRHRWSPSRFDSDKGRSRHHHRSKSPSPGDRRRHRSGRSSRDKVTGGDKDKEDSSITAPSPTEASAGVASTGNRLKGQEGETSVPSRQSRTEQQWQTAAAASFGDEKKQNKFLRLMGMKKSQGAGGGTSEQASRTSIPAHMADASELNRRLETQFIEGIGQRGSRAGLGS